MADINYGLNILPKTNNAYNLGSSTKKWNLYVNQINGDSIDNIGNGASAIIAQKTDNPTVINDGIPGRKLDDMKVSFSLKQEGSGDPSPTNIRPINGINGVNVYHAGKNIYDGQFPSLSSSLYYRYYFVGNSMVTGSSNVPLSDQGYGNVFLLPGKVNTGASTGMNNITNGVSQTVNPIDGWVTVAYRNSYDVDPSDYNVQIEVGTTATTYEPYSGTTIPISWQEEAGIVYSGQLNVLTGVLTVNMARADMGSATWTIGSNGNVHWFKSSRILTGAKVLSSNSYAANIVSDRFKNIQAAKIYSGEADDNTIAQESANTANGNLRVKATSYNDDTEAFTTAMSGVYVYYELATPLTYQLTPIQIALLTGINTIWTDADTAEIAYPVDTKKYVDKGSSEVKDVQVNGTSVLNNSVANIPYADNSNAGVVKTSGSIQIDGNGKLWVNNASDSGIKAGTSTTSYLTPSRQEQAVFYGLTKAAGVDMASSNNTVGTYTDSAKVAIAQMLGIGQLYSPIEEIANVVISQDSDEVNVTTDKYGNPFKLAYAQITLIFGTAASTTNDYISASCFDWQGVKRGMPTLRLINGSKCWMIHNFMSFGGLGFCLGKSTATGNTQNAQLATYNSTDSENGMKVLSMPYITGVQFKQYSTTTTPIIAGSRVVIYGCRVIE